MLPAIRVKIDPIAEQIIERYEIRYRTLDRSRFVEDVEAFLSIFNRSLVDHWGFVPMSPAEVKHLARGLSWLIVPELAVGAEIDGKLVGVALACPTTTPASRRSTAGCSPSASSACWPASTRSSGSAWCPPTSCPSIN